MNYKNHKYFLERAKEYAKIEGYSNTDKLKTVKFNLSTAGLDFTDEEVLLFIEDILSNKEEEKLSPNLDPDYLKYLINTLNVILYNLNTGNEKAAKYGLEGMIEMIGREIK